MNKRLFVGGIPYSTTEDELRQLFSEAGEVSLVNIPVDRFTGQGKGFAFVEMATEEGATKAIETINETEFGKRKITVNEARPREERPQRNFPDRRRSYDRGPRSKRW